MRADRPTPRRGRSAIVGLLAGAVALGIAELAAAFLRPQASPLLAVGAAGIDLTPEWLKHFAIQTFGTHDKQVLLGSLAAGVTASAILIGLAARRWIVFGLAGLVSFTLLGVAAALTRPDAGAADALPVLLGTCLGAAVLVLLLRAAAAPTKSGLGSDRRRFLLAGAGAAALAGMTGGLGRALSARRNVDAARKAVRLPSPAERALSVPAGADQRIKGLSSFVTGNRDFYRVDTALTLPQVDPGRWMLRVHGMVARPLEISFDELLRRPLTERDITLTCVSNEVGGPYVGNARWLGASLAGLLREAGVKTGADQILSRSADGWTSSTPIETVLDGRDALLAVGMNGEALPIAHGFPARMVVPGLYGYVSATKWVVDLNVTRFADAQSYWTRRGWSDHGPIKTLSRVDVPKPFQQIRSGRAVVAGVAWAQHRGIAAVEFRLDGGAWKQAQLAPVPGTDTWRQWVAEWNAVPGSHRLEVRATDATGATQPQQRFSPYPNGATGWHSVVVTVT